GGDRGDHGGGRERRPPRLDHDRARPGRDGALPRRRLPPGRRGPHAAGGGDGRPLRRPLDAVSDHLDRGRPGRGRLGRLGAPDRAARRPAPARRRRHLRHEHEPHPRRHPHAHRERGAHEAEPDRHDFGDARRHPARVVGGLRQRHLAPLRRDRGHDDCRPRRRHRLRPDQDGRAGPQRPRGQVQPARPHRGGAGRLRALSRPRGVRRPRRRSVVGAVTEPRPRRTKIVCTIGPASSDPETIEQLAWSGMDAARLNFSHGDQEMHRETLASVRRAQALIGRPLAVIADLQGPKIRIGRIGEPRSVNPGDTLVLTAPGEGAPGDLDVTFAGIADTVAPGREVLINDGMVRTRVASVEGARVITRVEVGGLISSGKGVNLPGTYLPIPSLTEKDESDLDFALGIGADYIALSFVRTAADVERLRERIDAAGSHARIVAKIEKAEAIENLDDIVAASDALMVARGDLGVEIGAADVPLVQKLIIRTGRDAGRAVITATQMLESMIHQPEPTRAEASDVANAVLDGTSALMLSGETAVGAYPLEAVATMNRIARAVEPSLTYLDAGEIACPTQSGSTARNVSRFRPRRPIVAASPDPVVLQQLALEWAVVPIVIEGATSTEDLWRRTVDAIRASGLAATGERVVLSGGTRLNQPGTTDHVVVRTIE